MKLSHLAFGIVLIIAVIVAAIITAFSIVTFESLDKAVENSMTSELDYVKNAVTSLIERTVVPVTAARDMFLGNNWTYRNLPARYRGRRYGCHQPSKLDRSLRRHDYLASIQQRFTNLLLFYWQVSRRRSHLE